MKAVSSQRLSALHLSTISTIFSSFIRVLEFDPTVMITMHGNLPSIDIVCYTVEVTLVNIYGQLLDRPFMVFRVMTNMK